MKTLRFLRNIAALFILGVTLLVSGPGVGLSQAGNSKVCAVKAGKNCGIDLTGNCTESACVKGQFCGNTGCAVSRFCKGCV
jgi:hypothetical protein